MSINLTRAEYDKLPIDAKPGFHKSGGKVVTNGANSTALDFLAGQMEDDRRSGKLITRDELAAMTLAEKSAFFKADGRVAGPMAIKAIAKLFGHHEQVANFVIDSKWSPEKFRAWCIIDAQKKNRRR